MSDDDGLGWEWFDRAEEDVRYFPKARGGPSIRKVWDTICDCPTCKAPHGRRCLNSSGWPMVESHVGRRHKARELLFKRAYHNPDLLYSDESIAAEVKEVTAALYDLYRIGVNQHDGRFPEIITKAIIRYWLQPMS